MREAELMMAVANVFFTKAKWLSNKKLSLFSKLCLISQLAIGLKEVLQGTIFCIFSEFLTKNVFI